MPYADNSNAVIPSALERLNDFRAGSASFSRYFNYNDPDPMSITDLAIYLRTAAEADYQHRPEKHPTNERLMSRALVGTLVPEPVIRLAPKKYTLSYSWNHLKGSDFLRAFAHPYATESRIIRLVVDDLLNKPISTAERAADKAEAVGNWVDVTLSTAGSFTGVGNALGVLQATADVNADLLDGKAPNYLAVASIVAAAIPGERLVIPLVRVSRTGAKALKYTLLIGDKAIDLATAGQSIKQSYETGEPLAIYQALLACGMSIRHSYAIARQIASQTKINNQLERTVSIGELEALENMPEEYTVSARPFKIGNTTLLGKIDAGKIKISRDNGVTWEQGSDLHKLAYRLQHAGGGRKLPAETSSPEQVETPVTRTATRPATVSTQLPAVHRADAERRTPTAVIDTSKASPPAPVSATETAADGAEQGTVMHTSKTPHPAPVPTQETTPARAEQGTVTHSSKTPPPTSVPAKETAVVRTEQGTAQPERGGSRPKTLKTGKDREQIKGEIRYSEGENVVKTGVKSLTELNNIESQDTQAYSIYSGFLRHPDTTFDRTTEHHMMLNKAGKFVLKMKSATQKVQVFDASTGKYTNSRDFTLSRSGFTTKSSGNLLSADALSATVDGMKKTSDRLTDVLKEYSGVDKAAITANLYIVKQALEDISINSSTEGSDSGVTTYALVKKGRTSEAENKSYGLINLHLDSANFDLSVHYLTAHPYVVVNKYPAFREYIIAQGLVSADELADYNIRNVARFLGTQALHNEIQYYDDIPNVKVNSISFYGENPITQRMGYRLETLTRFLSTKQFSEGENLDVEDFVSTTDHPQSRTPADPYQEGVDYLKTQVRETFNPVTPVEVVSDEVTQARIARMMRDYDARIVIGRLSAVMRHGESGQRAFARKVFKSANKAYIKVAKVKSLFDQAESQPEIRAELKRMLDEATGLNDEVTIDIDKKDVPAISDMVYNRFKENVVALYTFLGNQTTHDFNAFVLFEYNRFDSSQPDAFALPYDRQQRILLAVRPVELRHGGMTDTITHEASHNVAATLDHTYMGGMRDEHGAFPRSFQLSARDERYFFADERTSKLSANYALGLPETAVITPQQELTARSLLANSRLVKADTLLNSAEYNAYIVDVLSRHHTQNGHIWPNEDKSRPKRDEDAENPDLESSIILAALLFLRSC